MLTFAPILTSLTRIMERLVNAASVNPLLPTALAISCLPASCFTLLGNTSSWSINNCTHQHTGRLSTLKHFSKINFIRTSRPFRFLFQIWHATILLFSTNLLQRNNLRAFFERSQYQTQISTSIRLHNSTTLQKTRFDNC